MSGPGPASAGPAAHPDPALEGKPPIAEDLPHRSSKARSKSILGAIGLLLYMWLVFGVLLPSVVDYQAMLETFRGVPTEWLLIVVLVGVAGWYSEGWALKIMFRGLGSFRSTGAYLVQAAVGSTLTGAVKAGVGYIMFRRWAYSAQATVLGITLNSLAAQASKLLMPALWILLLTIAGSFPGNGILLALLLVLPVALALVVGFWVLRSEAFARRVGAFATRASGAVMRRMHKDGPEDLTPRLMDFRGTAGALLAAKALPITITQAVARTAGYVLMVVSMRAVGITSEVLPPDTILAVYAVVMVIGLLPIAPGGAGLPELLYISFFTSIVNNPAMDDQIAAGVMLMRGVSWFLPIPVGYLVLVLFRWEDRHRAPAIGDEVPAAAAPA
jgi:putative heme transporter